MYIGQGRLRDKLWRKVYRKWHHISRNQEEIFKKLFCGTPYCLWGWKNDNFKPFSSTSENHHEKTSLFHQRQHIIFCTFTYCGNWENVWKTLSVNRLSPAITRHYAVPCLYVIWVLTITEIEIRIQRSSSGLLTSGRHKVEKKKRCCKHIFKCIIDSRQWVTILTSVNLLIHYDSIYSNIYSSSHIGNDTILL